MIDTRRREPAVTLLQSAHLFTNKQTPKKLGRPSRREYGSRKVVWRWFLQGGRGCGEEGVGELCGGGKGSGGLRPTTVGHQPTGHRDGHRHQGQQGGDDEGNYKSYF